MAKPKPVGFPVKKLNPFKGKEWCVISYVDGKRKLKWLASEKEAKDYAVIQNRDRLGGWSNFGSKVWRGAKNLGIGPHFRN